MPTPQAMPVAIGRDHQKPGGGGKKNGGYATHGHGPYTTVGLNDGTNTTDGCAGSITITCGGADCCTTTVCVAGAGSAACTDTLTCSLDLRLPAACAFCRSRCTEFITSSGCARNASPMLRTQSGCPPNVISTSGNATSEATDGSQGSFSTIFTASSPLASGCAFDHAAAAAKSSG